MGGTCIGVTERTDWRNEGGKKSNSGNYQYMDEVPWACRNHHGLKRCILLFYIKIKSFMNEDFFLFVELRIKPRALCMLGKCSYH